MSPSDTRSNVETAQIALSAGEKKVRCRFRRFADRQYHEGFVSQFGKAVYGGALLNFGGNVALVVGSSPALQTSDPGLGKILFAVVFPIGLIMISLLGMELVTSCVWRCDRSDRAGP